MKKIANMKTILRTMCSQLASRERAVALHD